MKVEANIHEYFQISLEVLRKTRSDSYESIMKNPSIEFCKLIKGIASNPFFDAVLSMVDAVKTGMFDICRRSGDINIFNISHQNSSGVNVWPDGEYKTVARILTTSMTTL